MYDPVTRPDSVRYWPTGLDKNKLYGLQCKVCAICISGPACNARSTFLCTCMHNILDKVCL